MPLRQKLLLSMLIPAILLGMMTAIGVISLRHLERAAARILANNYRSIQEARRMVRALRLLETSGPGRTQVDDGVAQGKYRGQFADALRRCENNITEEGEREIIQKIKSIWGQLAIGEGRRISGPPQARNRLLTAMHDQIEELITLNERAMISSEKKTSRVARGMLGAVGISSLAAFLALALFAILSANRISRPVTEVTERLHQALNPVSKSDRLTSGKKKIDEIALLREELDALLLRLASYEDEQARKLSHLQGRLAFVMNEVLEGLVLMDSEYRILAANRVGRTILGMGTGEGHRLSELTPREDVQHVLSPLMEGTFQPERDLGEVHFNVDGLDRIFTPRILTVPASERSVEGFLLLFWDVTEQRRFEESKRSFISMLSHQLKTPMTSLTMSVNLIRERLGTADASQAELIAITSENCNSLSALVSDLIDASKGVAPDLKIKPQSIHLVRLLRSALRPLIPQAEEKGIQLIVPQGSDTLNANVDPVKFPWVVTNIAGNALRYTPRGGRIEVAVASTSEWIEVSVEDTGAGIDNRIMDRIFQPYVSLDPEPQQGTHGLGLAIAKEIVEAHDGEIHVNSEQGKGTRFVIRIPGRKGWK